MVMFYPQSSGSFEICLIYFDGLNLTLTGSETNGDSYLGLIFLLYALFSLVSVDLVDYVLSSFDFAS